MPWVQKYQWLADPPRLTNVPEGYENAVVKSGTHWPYYAYERFVDAPDWVQGGGVLKGKKLLWGRAFWYLPAQTFNIEQLQPDNTWKKTGTIDGPRLYLSLDGTDGDAMVQRLVAA